MAFLCIIAIQPIGLILPGGCGLRRVKIVKKRMQQTVLMVSGDRTQRRFAEQVVGKFGYRVVEVCDGAEAINYMNALSHPLPVLLLLDVPSGCTDAVRTVCAVKDFFAKLPIVALMPYGDMEHAMQTIRAGAVDFLMKPVEAERLHVSIRNALRLSALDNELQHLRNHSQKSTTALMDTQLPVCDENTSKKNYYQQESVAMKFDKENATMPLLDREGNVCKLIEMEEQAIRFALAYYEGHMSKVARMLGIGRSTLYRKLSDFGINPREELQAISKETVSQLSVDDVASAQVATSPWQTRRRAL